MLLFIAFLVLTACGGIQEEDSYTLKESIIVADSIEEFHEAMEEAQETGTLETGGPVTMVFDEDEIKIIEITNDDMVLIELIEGYDEGYRGWTHKGEIDRAI